MVQISRELLQKALSLTRLEVEVIGNDADCTLYDKEGYSSIKLTTKEGLELLKGE